jgi:hypothetical protein
VVIDRCNVHDKERKMWIREAKQSLPTTEASSLISLRFVSLFLDIAIDECKSRVQRRKRHPTLDPMDGDRVIDGFASGMSAPQKFEGFHELLSANSGDQVKVVVQHLIQALQSDKQGARKKA